MRDKKQIKNTKKYAVKVVKLGFTVLSFAVQLLCAHSSQAVNPDTIIQQGFGGHSGLLDKNLINMGGRHYDPMSGRFISPDPYTSDGVVDIGWNRYAYVGNNPLNRVDPTGYFGEPGIDYGPGESSYNGGEAIAAIIASWFGLNAANSSGITSGGSSINSYYINAPGEKRGNEKNSMQVTHSNNWGTASSFFLLSARMAGFGQEVAWLNFGNTAGSRERVSGEAFELGNITGLESGINFYGYTAVEQQAIKLGMFDIANNDQLYNTEIGRELIDNIRNTNKKVVFVNNSDEKFNVAVRYLDLNPQLTMRRSGQNRGEMHMESEYIYVNFDIQNALKSGTSSFFGYSFNPSVPNKSGRFTTSWTDGLAHELEHVSQQIWGIEVSKKRKRVQAGEYKYSTHKIEEIDAIDFMNKLRKNYKRTDYGQDFHIHD